MEYNSAREKLIISEYGRHVQSLIKYAVTVEDDVKRNKVAKYIIELMCQMNPHLKTIEEFRRKLWDHLFLISDFKLDVESPYPIPTKEQILNKHIAPLPYPKQKIEFKHYGKNVEVMIDRARKTEDKEKQKAFAEVIGNYMKMVYNNWNSDNINDEVIKNDMRMLSKGELKIGDNINLDALTRSNRNKKRPQKSGSNYDKKSKWSRGRKK